MDQPDKDNEVSLYSIGELCDKNFFIPAYQRGYRWDEQQVKDLLNDIHGFAAEKDKEEGAFYCLQPIVIKKLGSLPDELSAGGTDWWEVVDGQQRLTTLRIILEYLEHAHQTSGSNKPKVFGLRYETRPGIDDFLQALANGNSPDPEGYTVDHYHIAQAYHVAKDWFEQQPGQDIRSELVRQVLVSTAQQPQHAGSCKIIWYQLPTNENPIESFTRINLGKIPLTSSELIKALFLQARTFGAQNELVRLRQLEIATEWDRIENALQNDSFWWFLNKSDEQNGTRIEFILDILCRQAYPKDSRLNEQIRSDGYATFRYYYQQANDVDGDSFVEREWTKIVDCFNQLLEWYLNSKWYHYVGYLIYYGESVETLLAVYKASTRKEITTNLQALIAAKLTDVQWQADGAGGAYLNVTYDKPETVRRVLLLFNLQEIIEEDESVPEFDRFPFQVFKRTRWDIEHIDSSSPRALTSVKDQKDWLQVAKEDIPKHPENSGLFTCIESFLAATTDDGRQDFQDLQQTIAAAAGEEINDEASKNNIGNLTLLDAGTNRSYGNALFVTKRRILLKKDREGVFIPPCTKQVFLKYFDAQGIFRTSWKKEDIYAYRLEIANKLEGFLPSRPIVKHEEILPD